MDAIIKISFSLKILFPNELSCLSRQTFSPILTTESHEIGGEHDNAGMRILLIFVNYEAANPVQIGVFAAKFKI
jgi:hypothetical protein